MSIKKTVGFHSELGQVSSVDAQYNPDRLQPIARSLAREALLCAAGPDFYGIDVWNAYELSWCDNDRKPHCAGLQLAYDAHSPNIVESKSLKLYLQSLNATSFASTQALLTTIAQDVGAVVGAPVDCQIMACDQIQRISPVGLCIDHHPCHADELAVNPDHLQVAGEAVVEERLYSHLLRSNCLVTNQPDWATVVIAYRGPAIDQAGLLQYLCSYRHHQGFHEQCVEQIFFDCLAHLPLQQLTVYAHYTRRGGIDINPLRSTVTVRDAPVRHRLARQ